MFSFTPTKNITTGEGGMVTTDDAELARRLRLLRNHGQTDAYRHVTLGWNWRLTELQAAMGVVQLGKLDAILARKRDNATFLDRRLPSSTGVRPPVARPDRDHVHMLYTVQVDGDRDAVMAALADDGIEARVYFPPGPPPAGLRQPEPSGRPPGDRRARLAPAVGAVPLPADPGAS